MTRKMINKLGIVLATVIMLSMVLSPVKALAKGTIVEEKFGSNTISWDDIVNQDGVKAIISEGQLVEFSAVPCKIWIPATLQAEILSDIYSQSGFVGYYTSADRKDVVSIVDVNVGGMSIADYKKAVENYEGVSEVASLNVNGMEGVIYNLKRTDSTSVSFITDSGHVMEFTFAPMSDDEFATLAAYMIASITK